MKSIWFLTLTWMITMETSNGFEGTGYRGELDLFPRWVWGIPKHPYPNLVQEYLPEGANV